ncbi:MAG: thioredoxin domain-containing protein [Polyangiales bacterium]
MSAPAPPPKNRLALEASPYLRQHESNPVDWYPWGPEALERSRREDKPILLSIGYSACHWCHVMAHESFEDAAIAAKMNALFVCVKVDREERPDLDQLYQLTVQLMGRSGGWPLTVFLTPEQKPFFAGTYFPPADRHGMSGFPRVLDAIAEAFTANRGEVETQASELAGAIGRVTQLELRGDGGTASLGPELLERASKAMGKRFDDAHGGFGQKPKFPNTMALDVLLRRSVEGTGDLTCEQRVKRALVSMRQGGIWDHLGGGFHRYSTDERWLVPHFEKMLYDNALLARLYVDAARAYGDPRFAECAHEILRWVAREMTADDGAFFCTQDADSVPEGAAAGTHPEEGAFFSWTPAQVRAACGEDEEAARVALAHFGVTERGNFEQGATVLSEAMPIEEAAQSFGVTADVARAALERARTAMFARREQRPKPFRDEKVLASWNGLMIGACAEVAMATSDPTARAMAERAFTAIEARLIVDGRVGRVSPPPGHVGGATRVPGYLDDHSFLACAALDLYELTQTPRYVEVARALVSTAIAHFADVAGGFFFSADDAEQLIHRGKEPFDQAIPSGQSMMALALLRLHALDGAPELEERARRTLEPLADAASQHPLGLSPTVIALDRLARGSTDVVVVGGADDARTRGLLDAVRRTYVPHRTLASVDPGDPTSAAACPVLAEGKEPKGHPVAYVCRGRTCSPPVADAAALGAALRAHP